jgi:hypothetical protein
MQMQAQSTSDVDLIDEIFKVMELRYRRVWVDSFDGQPMNEVREQWRNDLAEFSFSELKRGIELSKRLPYPPTLGAFIATCRPPLDYEAIFNHAIKNLRLREENKDEWANAGVYWAAVKMTYEMRNNPYEKIKISWKNNLDAAYAAVKNGKLPNKIPPLVLALPPVGRHTLSKNEVGVKLTKMWEVLGVDKNANHEVVV